MAYFLESIKFRALGPGPHSPREGRVGADGQPTRIGWALLQLPLYR